MSLFHKLSLSIKVSCQRTEFGNVVQIEEVEEGIIIGYQVHKGNASDKHHLTPALTRHHKIFKKSPRELAADAGYFSKQNEDTAYELE